MMLPRALAVLALAAVSAPPPAVAAEPAEWRLIDTPSFEFVSPADEDYVRQLAGSLERLRQVLAQVAPAAVANVHERGRIFVFPDVESYATHSSPSPGGKATGIGVLFPHPDGYYATLVGIPNLNPETVLYQQYIHQLLLDNLRDLPEWFRHGLAEFYSTFVVEGDQASVGQPLKGHLLLLRQPDAPPLSLAALRSGPGDGDGSRFGNYFAAQSWVVMHYLLGSTPEHAAQVTDLVRRIAAGKPAEEAFRETFGPDDSVLEKEVSEYIEQNRFKYARLALQALGPVAIGVRPLAPLEVLALKGDLLAHVAPGRALEAAALLRQVVEAQPEHGAAWYGLGFLSRQAGDHEAALASLERASRLLAGDFHSHFAYGDSLLRTLEGRRPEGEKELERLATAEAALQAATGLRRDSADAWDRLGFAYGLEPEAFEEGVRALETALHLAPGRTDIAFNLLLAHARLGDGAEVTEMERKLERLGADAATLHKAREVRLQLRFNEGNRLIRASRFADAAGYFAQVRAETRNPGLAQLAAERFEQVSAVAQYNRFAELYQQARQALAEGSDEERRRALDELLAAAKPGLQEEVARELAAESADSEAANP